MSPRVSPRPREAESSFAEFRSKLQSNGHYFPTADRDLLFWRYLTEGGPIVEEFGHERLATLGEEEHRTLSKATGPAGGFLVPTDFADSIETARRARNVIAAVSRVIETDHGRALERAFAGPAYVDRGLVFADALGGPIHPQRLTEAFGKLRKAAGLPTGTLHVLRHTAATLALTNGVPVHVVAARLGDTANTVFATYAHLLPQSDELAAETVAALLA